VLNQARLAEAQKKPEEKWVKLSSRPIVSKSSKGGKVRYFNVYYLFIDD